MNCMYDLTASFSLVSVFGALLVVRLVAAFWSNISDCDETFNYWEPTHFIVHGSGMQTWEYSPLYAIRSYAYLWIYGLPSAALKYLGYVNRVHAFYFTRCLLGLFSAVCETFFYK